MTPRIQFHEVLLGDRRRTGRGWLILSEGAIRGILTGASDGSVIFGMACDRRIQPTEDLMIFRDLLEAKAWLDRRITEWLPQKRDPSKQDLEDPF